MKLPGPRRRPGLAARLLAGQTVVLIAGMLTAGLVAALVGPALFHEHLLQAGQAPNSPELEHIEQAYRDASLLSLGIALVISLLSAVAVTWILTRRLRRPLTGLTDAARELSRGHYAHRVPDTGSGTELDTLAGAFNSMAGRLEEVEDTRRRLLSDLAHELRTPISTLTAYHDGLHDGVTEMNEESRSVLAEQTDRLTRLADDINEVSTADEGRLELDLRPHSIGDVIWPACEPLRERFAAKEVTLDIRPSPDLVVIADRQRIGQVLTNLLTNALRHTPAGGRVAVRAAQEGADVAIILTDTGDGILAAQLPHVFERFYRTDSARDRDRSGSGIGLTISKAIVDAHGGTIAAASQGRGHGSCFRILLPLAPPSGSGVAQSEG